MNDANSPFVLKARDARGVVTLTLNRPASFNALSEGMLDALEQAIAEIAADENVRAVVIAAAGKARSRFSRLQGYRQSGPLPNDLSRCAAAMETKRLTE